MTDDKRPTPTDADAARAERFAQDRAAVERIKKSRLTPEQDAEIARRGEQAERAQIEHEKRAPGLDIPPKDTGGRNR